jgi:hypothetical protein
MSKQQHFVVVVEENGEMWVDYDTAGAKFDGFYTFDTDTDQWIDTQDESYADYETASELLHDLLLVSVKKKEKTNE